MSVVPNGYVTVRDALNQIGKSLFPKDWTGEEHEARSGLISREEWDRLKNTPATGHFGSGARPYGYTGPLDSRGSYRPPAPSFEDPDTEEYQAERVAHDRFSKVFLELHTRLEAGLATAAIVDPWSGKLEKISRAEWRRNDADRFLLKGRS